MNNSVAIIEESHPIFLALAEIQKSRSRFQLEKFVVGQHDTDDQQYRQTLLEIQNLFYKIKVVKLELKKHEIEIARLKATGDEIDAIDAEIKELGMEQTRLTMIGAERELKDLVEMWEMFEHKYTYEEMEQLQPEYWSARLTRQAQLEAMGSGGKVGWASLDALRQVGEFEVPQIANVEEPVKELK
jgi:tRNA nucleotidyltransferase/poly(A) polymerase